MKTENQADIEAYENNANGAWWWLWYQTSGYVEQQQTCRGLCPGHNQCK